MTPIIHGPYFRSMIVVGMAAISVDSCLTLAFCHRSGSGAAEVTFSLL